LGFDLYQSSSRDVRIRAAFPLRAAIASDFKDTQGIGYVFSPYLQLRYYGGAESSISIGPIWASEDYHDYFYEVAPAYATAGRPEYDAQSGYSGSRITLTSSYRWNNYWLGLFARYDNLNDAVFADSPVMRQSDSLMLGVGFAWVFKSTLDN
ncbi:MAG: MipA/OmpV family protein, partial [Gammaproteobacteria bacterium]|nr:MipA/OmpV family protein [Gammaproteobacteria bacterium]